LSTRERSLLYSTVLPFLFRRTLPEAAMAYNLPRHLPDKGL
jgi:hypothetical protein